MTVGVFEYHPRLHCHMQIFFYNKREIVKGVFYAALPVWRSSTTPAAIIQPMPTGKMIKL